MVLRNPNLGPCGHYYPDVVRLRDFEDKGNFYRVYDCVNCGKYQSEISREMCSKYRVKEGEIRKARERKNLSKL